MKTRSLLHSRWLRSGAGFLSVGLSLAAVSCASSKPQTTLPAPQPAAGIDDDKPKQKPAAEPVVAAVKVNPASKVRTVEGITEYKLDNGMQVLLFPDDSQDTITVNITYLVGSRMEGYGETGMAHLLEHMMFKGTKKFRNVLKLIDERGGQANGTTWTDRTNYYETLPATEQNLEWALDLESDRMLNAQILAEDLATEFSVVRNEFEMGENDPSAILQERMASTAFLWHNYGKSTIGSRADIEKVPIPALRAFYEKYYQPDNATLVVAGKFDDKKALAMIERKFGAIVKPSRVIPPTYTVEPVQDGERDVVLRRNGDVAVVGAMWHVPGTASPDATAIDAAMDILTNEPAGRLYKALVTTKLAASVSGGGNGFRDPYVAQIMAQVRDPKTLDKVLAIINKETENLANSKIDDSELERWRNQRLKQFDLMLADSDTVAVILSEAIAAGDWRSLFASREQIKAVKVADVARVAKAYFKQSNRTTGRFIPTKDADRAPQLETPNIAEIVKGIEGGAGVEAGEAFAATFANIEARTIRKDLAGGIKAAFLPKKTRGGKVTLSLSFRFGDEKSRANKEAVADLAFALLARGTKTKSYTEISDLMSKLKAEISIRGGSGNMLIAIDTLRDQLAPALNLAGEIALSPGFPASELEVVRQEALAGLEEQRQDPQALGFMEFTRAFGQWPKSDPRYVASVDEQIAAIKKVTLDEIKNFYRDLAGGGNGLLTVVGDFDQVKVAEQVEKLFGTWKSKAKYERLADKLFETKPGERAIDTKDKENAVIALGHKVAMKSTDPDYAAWTMLGFILGGDSGSKLWMRVREKEGLSYGVFASTDADDEDVVGSVMAGGIVAPQNLAKAKASILDEIQKIADGQIDEADVKRAKEAWVKQQDNNLTSDTYLRRMLGENSYYGRTTAWQSEIRAKIVALTAADIAKVAKKWLDPKKLVVVSAGDAAKMK